MPTIAQLWAAEARRTDPESRQQGASAGARYLLAAYQRQQRHLAAHFLRAFDPGPSGEVPEDFCPIPLREPR